MHPVVHCLVVSSGGQLLLQLRSQTKDVQPGKWDTSVGGHVMLGESIEAALQREGREEIGIDLAPAQFLYRYVMRSDIETELVHAFLCRSDGPFRRQASEIDELRFFRLAEIESVLGGGNLTPNFEQEYRRYRQYLASASG